MAKAGEPYQEVIVESYCPAATAGLHGAVHIRPVLGQGFDGLHVECSKSLSDLSKHPLGTKFKIRAKLTDREGQGDFLYSYFGWRYEVID